MLDEINSTLLFTRAARVRNPPPLRTALTLLLISSLISLAPIRSAYAQQETSIKQLKEQIELMMEIQGRADTTSEIKQINGEFLKERRNHLRALLKGRIEVLREYLATIGKSLTSEETRLIEISLRNLQAEL